MRLPAIILGSFLASVAGAQTLAPTISGYLYEASSRSLRPVIGVPGSAYVGTTVLTDLDGAWAAPSKEAAIVNRGGETALVLGLRSMEPRQYEGRLLDRLERATWNSSGTAAVLYSAADGLLQRINLFNKDVQTGSPEPVGSFGSLGSFRSLAVSDSGKVAIATADGIYLWPLDGSPRLINGVSSSALSFAGDVLYATDGKTIFEIGLEDGSSKPLVTDLAIQAFGASSKAGRIWATTADRKLYVWTVSGSPVAEIALETNPLASFPLQGESLFVLNGLEGKSSPVVLLDLRAEPAVVFVPAAQLSAL